MENGGEKLLAGWKFFEWRNTSTQARGARLWCIIRIYTCGRSVLQTHANRAQRTHTHERTRLTRKLSSAFLPPPPSTVNCSENIRPAVFGTVLLCSSANRRWHAVNQSLADHQRRNDTNAQRARGGWSRITPRAKYRYLNIRTILDTPTTTTHVSA